ncbi:condensation protein [Streptomyces triticagri]|uniref:Condensation protein n=1 Tax=Streptomyces triticagri TaxID=2293568 RepID=A0A372LXC9_9ACTN|nr:condensation protein [Streptomyces triticagri]RFU82955.1 condensation protein [Streptomyces triticagri]
MTAVDHPAQRPGAPEPPPRRVPFPVVDEVSRHCLQEEEPETVHIEVHLPGRPDRQRLTEAFHEALRRHPRVLMREAPRRWYARRYEWELTRDPDVPVVSFPAAAPDAFEAARARALASAPPLAASPPVRLECVEDAGGGGSVLFLVVNHTALDGPACLRVLATAAELYGGVDNAPAAPPVRAADAPGQPVAMPSGLARPARIAAGAPASAGGRPYPGNGMLVADLPVPHRPKGAPYTVNDQLMVATTLMIAEWNREHGGPRRPMRITMPVDDRPRDASMPIGNGTRLVEVPFAAHEVDPDRLGALLRLTAGRTRALKAAQRPQLGHGAALLTSPVLPVAARAALTRALRAAAGPWTSTTLLSNIGRIPYAMDFGDAGRASAVWFSAPARVPRGLTVTTASTSGRLHLALRWSRTLLGPDDGARLRDLFQHYLHATEDPR